MESEEFKVMLVVVLGVALLATSVNGFVNTYWNGYYYGQVQLLQPKEAK